MVRFQQNKKAPALRMQATIEAITESRNPAGEVLKTWTTEVTVRCALVSMNGEEMANAATMGAKANFKIIMRHYAGLTTKKRFKIGSRYFNITHILTDEGYNHYMEVSVMEKLTGG